MRIGNSQRVGLFLLVALSLPIACSNTLRFERVEHFPAGMQIDTLSSAWVNGFHPSEISQQFDAPYSEVWEAAKLVAKRLELRVEKAELTVDEAAGKITVTDEQQMLEDVTPRTEDRGQLRRPGGSRLGGWKDEFLVRVSPTPDGRIMVTVSRAVLGMPRYRFCIYVVALCQRGTYEPEISNGQIENWMLTQIADEVMLTMIRERYI